MPGSRAAVLQFAAEVFFSILMTGCAGMPISPIAKDSAHRNHEETDRAQQNDFGDLPAGIADGLRIGTYGWRFGNYHFCQFNGLPSTRCSIILSFFRISPPAVC